MNKDANTFKPNPSAYLKKKQIMTKWSLSQQSEVGLTLEKSVIAFHHSNRMKKKTYIINSLYAGTACDKSKQ